MMEDNSYLVCSTLAQLFIELEVKGNEMKYSSLNLWKSAIKH